MMTAIMMMMMIIIIGPYIGDNRLIIHYQRETKSGLLKEH